MESINNDETGPQCSEQNGSSNIASNEIDQETVNKLRGDAIGDTMYSEVFVLNTLLQFSDLKWSEEVEENLCFLWDMSEEKDVCEYLFKVNYPRLACSAIQNYNEGRFLEIVVGIFANLLCSKCEHNETLEEVKIVVNLLNSDDPYILTQVMRFLHALAHLYEKLEFIEREQINQFCFILCNSTNKELLVHCLKTLTVITEEGKLQNGVINSELVKCVIMAYRTLNEGCDENELFDSEEKHSNVRHVIQSVCNMCSYIDNTRLASEFRDNIEEFNRDIVFLLKYYQLEDNLFPIDEVFSFYMEALTCIYRILSVGYTPIIAKELYNIFLILYKRDPSNVHHVMELFCYFISVGCTENFQNDFQNVDKSQINEVLTYIRTSNLEFEFNYVKNVELILKNL